MLLYRLSLPKGWDLQTAESDHVCSTGKMLFYCNCNWYSGTSLKQTPLGPPLCVQNMEVSIFQRLLLYCILGLLSMKSRPLHCRAMLRKAIWVTVLTWSLNPPEVAHNLIKAVDKNPHYQVNCVQFKYCWDLGSLSTLQDMEVSIFQGFWLYTNL